MGRRTGKFLGLWLISLSNYFLIKMYKIVNIQKNMCEFGKEKRLKMKLGESLSKLFVSCIINENIDDNDVNGVDVEPVSEARCS